MTLHRRGRIAALAALDIEGSDYPLTSALAAVVLPTRGRFHALLPHLEAWRDALASAAQPASAADSLAEPPAVRHQGRSLSIAGPDEITGMASQGWRDGGFLGVLRAVALIAVVAGAGGSVGLMFRAGRRTPRLLLILFVIWVLSPFVALAWANIVSKRWPVLTRVTLYCVTLVLTLGSLAIYGGLVSPPAGSARAFVFVAVPPVSWLLLAIVVPMAALISRRRSRPGVGA